MRFWRGSFLWKPSATRLLETARASRVRDAPEGGGSAGRGWPGGDQSSSPTGRQQALRSVAAKVFWLAAVPEVLDSDGVSASPSAGTAFKTMRPR